MLYIILVLAIILIGLVIFLLIEKQKKENEIKHEINTLKEDFIQFVRQKVNHPIDLQAELASEMKTFAHDLDNDVSIIVDNICLKNRNMKIEFSLSTEVAKNLVVRNPILLSHLSENLLKPRDETEELLSPNILRLSVKELFHFYLKENIETEEMIWEHYESEINEILHPEDGEPREKFEQEELLAINDSKKDQALDALAFFNQQLEIKILELLLYRGSFFSVQEEFKSIKQLNALNHYTASAHYDMIFGDMPAKTFTKNIIALIEGEDLSCNEPINPMGKDKKRLFEYYYQQLCTPEDQDQTINNIKNALNRETHYGKIVNFPTEDVLELRDNFVIFKEKFLHLTETLSPKSMYQERAKLGYQDLFSPDKL